MKTLKYYFNRAYKEHWAMGQFNFSDWSQVKGIVETAKKLQSPIILGTSEGESKFVGLQEAVAMRNVLRKKTGLPIFLNLDHGKSLVMLKEAIMAGYDAVHFDGSKLTKEENIKISREAVKLAKRKNVIVEGEIGRISTDASKVYTSKFEIKEEDLTKVEDAKEYFSKTKVNILAIGIGTFHGINTGGISPSIRLDRLKEIRNNVKVPLVLHGGSGTAEEDLKEAIRLGVVKININTETRIAFSRSLRKTLEDNKEEITPYKYLGDSILAVQKVIEEKIMLFGSNNKI